MGIAMSGTSVDERENIEQCYIMTQGIIKTKILNLKRSRDSSLLQKVRKQGACSSYCYSEMI